MQIIHIADYMYEMMYWKDNYAQPPITQIKAQQWESKNRENNLLWRQASFIQIRFSVVILRYKVNF